MSPGFFFTWKLPTFPPIINMDYMKAGKPVLAVILATAWISSSEFVRNQFLLSSYWTAHYREMGLVFPARPLNGAIWGLWSMMLAVCIFILSRKFSLISTTLIAWIMGFVMMWLVIGNLSVLPCGILVYAIPLSLLEALVATVIVRQLRVRE